MDRLVLRRSGLQLGREGLVGLGGQWLAFGGTIALTIVEMDGPPLVFLGLLVAFFTVIVLFPQKVLVADDEGIAFGAGPRDEPLDWDTITRVVVDEDAGVVTVGVRIRRGDTEPARPLLDGLLNRLPEAIRPARGDRPFALAGEVVLRGRPASDVAGRLSAVAPAPVVWAAGDGRPSYRVRAPRRSVLPFGLLVLAWIGGVGTAMTVTTLREHPGAVLPLALIGVGAVLAVADAFTPDWILVANGGGLRFDGEFLAGDEIEAVEATAVPDGTDLRIRLVPGTPAAATAPEVQRTLRHVRVDPTRLAVALPPHVRTGA